MPKSVTSTPPRVSAGVQIVLATLAWLSIIPEEVRDSRDSRFPQERRPWMRPRAVRRQTHSIHVKYVHTAVQYARMHRSDFLRISMSRQKASARPDLSTTVRHSISVSSSSSSSLAAAVAAQSTGRTTASALSRARVTPPTIGTHRRLDLLYLVPIPSPRLR